MEITWAGRWNVAEDNEESEAVAIGSLEALARRSSDTMKELIYNWNSLSKTLFSQPYIHTLSMLQRKFFIRVLVIKEFVCRERA